MKFAAKKAKRHEPKHLWHKHHEILRLHVSGLKNNEIAETLGVSLPVISYTLNSGLGKAHLARLQQQMDIDTLDAGESIRETAKQSQAFLSAIASGEVDTTVQLRARVCMDNLDRAGYPKITKSVNMDLEGTLTAEDIAQIKRDAFGHKDCVQIEAEEISSDD